MNTIQLENETYETLNTGINSLAKKKSETGWDWDMTHRILKIRTNLRVGVNENTSLAPVLKIEKRVEDDILTMSEKTDSTDLAWFFKAISVGTVQVLNSTRTFPCPGTNVQLTQCVPGAAGAQQGLHLGYTIPCLGYSQSLLEIKLLFCTVAALP